MTAEELERKNKKYESVVKAFEEKERDLSRELASVTAKVTRLDKELTEKIVLVDSIYHLSSRFIMLYMTAKVQNYDQIKTRLEKVEKEFGIASNELVLKTAQWQQALDEREEMNRKLSGVQQKEELVKMDKLYQTCYYFAYGKWYLTKEAETYKTKSFMLEEKVERQKRKLRDVKKVREELFQQVIKTKDEQKTSYEQKLQVMIYCPTRS